MSQIRGQVGTKSTSQLLSGDGTTTTTLFEATDNIVERRILQTGTIAFFVKQGDGCSSTNFDFIIPAGKVAYDGIVTPLVLDNYYGKVTALATSAGTFNCNVSVLTAF